jgi:hypothetical protein
MNKDQIEFGYDLPWGVSDRVDDNLDALRAYAANAADAKNKYSLRCEIFGKPKFEPPKPEEMFFPPALRAMQGHFACSSPAPKAPHPSVKTVFDILTEPAAVPSVGPRTFAFDFNDVDCRETMSNYVPPVLPPAHTVLPSAVIDDCSESRKFHVPIAIPEHPADIELEPIEPKLAVLPAVAVPAAAAPARSTDSLTETIGHVVEFDMLPVENTSVVPSDSMYKKGLFFPTPVEVMQAYVSMPSLPRCVVNGTWHRDNFEVRMFSDFKNFSFAVDPTETYPNGSMIEFLMHMQNMGYPSPLRNEMSAMFYHAIRCNFVCIPGPSGNFKIVPGVPELPDDCHGPLMRRISHISYLLALFSDFCRDYGNEGSIDAAWYQFSRYYKWSVRDLLACFSISIDLGDAAWGKEAHIFNPMCPPAIPVAPTVVMQAVAGALQNVRERVVSFVLPDEESYTEVLYLAALYGIPVFLGEASPHGAPILFLTREPGPLDLSPQFGFARFSCLRALFVYSKKIVRLQRMNPPDPVHYVDQYVRLQFKGQEFVSATRCSLLFRREKIYLSEFEIHPIDLVKYVNFAYLRCGFLHKGIYHPKRWSAYVPFELKTALPYPYIGKGVSHCFYSFSGHDAGTIGNMGVGVRPLLESPYPWPRTHFRQVVHIPN